MGMLRLTLHSAIDNQEGLSDPEKAALKESVNLALERAEGSLDNKL